MKEPKPIFIVGVPNLSQHEHQDATESLQKRMPDYHILIYASNAEQISFKAFYAKDLIEADFETFKQEIKKLLPTP